MEVEGSGRKATLWALVFGTSDIRRGEEVKVALRMAGAGQLSLRATGPGAATLGPDWGPEPHGSSNWHRPGDEWGTGWTFPTPGCWTIHATRAQSGDGEVSFDVAA
ncbi:hypothetical protein ACFWZ2_08480 [Streptomyces sp. NPDC059002]|uniref:hypothetical protein n=1 Tax=Streptomyces sp. NPDC059002 TaxID=3346690 RepID=UPI0036859AE2